MTYMFETILENRRDAHTKAPKKHHCCGDKLFFDILSEWGSFLRSFEAKSVNLEAN